MGRLIAVLALAGAAAFAVHPGSGSGARAHTAAAPVAAGPVSGPSDDAVIEAAEKDLARRQAELGLVGAAPLFGAEGLPKPAAVR
jgi:hypothetical protein